MREPGTFQAPRRCGAWQLLCLSCSLEAEHVEHRGGRSVLQFRRVLEEGDRLARADEHGDVLLAVDRVADRRRVDAGANAEAPDLLQGLGVMRGQRAVQVADE